MTGDGYDIVRNLFRLGDTVVKASRIPRMARDIHLSEEPVEMFDFVDCIFENRDALRAALELIQTNPALSVIEFASCQVRGEEPGYCVDALLDCLEARLKTPPNPEPNFTLHLQCFSLSSATSLRLARALDTGGCLNSLTRLSLASINFDGDGFGPICAALPRTSLRSLSLRGYRDRDWVWKLMQGVMGTPSLLVLDLNGCILDVDDTTIICDALPSTQLTTLKLNNTALLSKELIALAESALRCPREMSLHNGGNPTQRSVWDGAAVRAWMKVARAHPFAHLMSFPFPSGGYELRREYWKNVGMGKTMTVRVMFTLCSVLDAPRYATKSPFRCVPRDAVRKIFEAMGVDW